MLGYRLPHFRKALELLRIVESHPDDLSSLRNLQKILIREIFLAEQGITRHKNNLQTRNTQIKIGRKSKQEAGALKKLAKNSERWMEHYRDTIYFWRCFGDAICFLYLDKYAIKQLSFNTENLDSKRSAGFLSGKGGLGQEIAVLEDSLSRGVPAVLCDLTNCMRHGDVCLLGASDPYLVEVKSSERLSERGQRQTAAIETLHGFFENDEAPSLRGMQNVRRRAAVEAEINYTDAMNDCIQAAMLEGGGIVSPEEGLHYLATTDGSITKLLRRVDLDQPIIFQLNPKKTSRSWGFHYPFILSIRNNDSLISFIEGNLYIIVIVNWTCVERKFLDYGFVSRFAPDENYIVRYARSKSDDEAGISASFFERVAFDLTSPSWIVRHTVESFEHYERLAEASA